MNRFFHRHALIAISSVILIMAGAPAAAGPDPDGAVWISDDTGNLKLHLNLDHRCVVDQLQVFGRSVLSDRGAFSGVKAGGFWRTTRRLGSSPTVTKTGGTVTVSGIRFGGLGLAISETWTFTPGSGSIRWRIERRYDRAAVLQDIAFPAWNFATMQTWTGALLDTGGVAWPKLFRRVGSSYACRAGAATFWNAETGDALRIAAAPGPGAQTATRFTYERDGAFSLTEHVAPAQVRPAHEQRRYLLGKSDVWAPVTVPAGTVTMEYTLAALRYDDLRSPGDLKGIDGGAVREIVNTIGRIGAIDRDIMGSNGWYSGALCLHEPWFALMGLAIQDPDYDRSLARAFDSYRDLAVLPSGRVKSRWSYNAWDSIPGTYDANGFYEAKWGILLDSQPSYVSNVAELFHATGDRAWLTGQRDVCRRVLDYTLATDSDHDGLVESQYDSHTEEKSSDWIDVVWAAHENAVVNAEMYAALREWAEMEDVLGDSAAAKKYRAAAALLKESFNRPTGAGGLWDPEAGCYVHWRNRDGEARGNNFVLPVNFMAIAFGIADPLRSAKILDRVEEETAKENLFFWPLCLFSYRQEEVLDRVNWPFPRYENGDMFLAWGELGMRAYAGHRPEIALKYLRNVLARYRQDGLAFQRYLRRSQTGAGEDILANNMLVVSGLYRDLYGILPRHDRLCLNPHLTPELAGTSFTYTLRGRPYHLTLNLDAVTVESGGIALTARGPFAVSGAREGDDESLTWYAWDGNDGIVADAGNGIGLTVTRAATGPAVGIKVESPGQPGSLVVSPGPLLAWTATADAAGAPLSYRLTGLSPGGHYTLTIAGSAPRGLDADPSGAVTFTAPAGPHSCRVEKAE